MKCDAYLRGGLAVNPGLPLALASQASYGNFLDFIFSILSVRLVHPPRCVLGGAGAIWFKITNLMHVKALRIVTDTW